MYFKLYSSFCLRRWHRHVCLTSRSAHLGSAQNFYVGSSFYIMYLSLSIYIYIHIHTYTYTICYMLCCFYILYALLLSSYYHYYYGSLLFCSWSVLVISIRETSIRGSRIPEPLFIFALKCPLQVQISQGRGWVHFFQIELLKTGRTRDAFEAMRQQEGSHKTRSHDPEVRKMNPSRTNISNSLICFINQAS